MAQQVIEECGACGRARIGMRACACSAHIYLGKRVAASMSNDCVIEFIFMSRSQGTGKDITAMQVEFLCGRATRRRMHLILDCLSFEAAIFFLLQVPTVVRFTQEKTEAKSRLQTMYQIRRAIRKGQPPFDTPRPRISAVQCRSMRCS
eukprot:6192403-Pleurochrysis_carterae.AAC.3